jgi:TatD DNase family protein
MLKNIEIAEKYSNVVCAVGIHPNEYFGGYNIDDMKKLVLEHPKIVAIGEVRFEYFYDDTPRDLQWKLFEEMLQLASDVNLPVILHLRECFSQDLFDILRHFNVSAVLHCFTDTLENAKKALDDGYYVSFSGIVTFKKSEALREVSKYIPDDRILIETDSPYLTPEPKRKVRINEPGFVRYVAECVAIQRNCTVEYLDEITTKNFFELFTKATEAFGLHSVVR